MDRPITVQQQSWVEWGGEEADAEEDYIPSDQDKNKYKYKYEYRCKYKDKDRGQGADAEGYSFSSACIPFDHPCIFI